MSLKDIRRVAMDLLARREHSETELVRKLRLRGFSDTDIQPLLVQLSEEKCLDHTRFIESYLYQRRNKGFGPLRIHAELTERGISEELIEHHLKITDNAWFIEARKVWQKRFKSHRPQDFKARAQQMRFLQYRGFTAEQIDRVFREDPIFIEEN